MSAKLGKGVELLRGLIIERMPEGPALYPDETVTDQPLDVRLAEIVREKALAVTRQEVPHSIAVVVHELELGDGLAKVFASLIVERHVHVGALHGEGVRLGARVRERQRRAGGGGGAHRAVREVLQLDGGCLRRVLTRRGGGPLRTAHARDEQDGGDPDGCDALHGARA